MKLRIALLTLALGSQVAAFAAPPSPVVPSPPVLTADHLQGSFDNQEAVATGHARLVSGDVILTADEIRYQTSAGVATARGQLVITDGDLRVLAEEGSYALATGVIRLKNPRAGSPPFYFTGHSLEGTLREFVLIDATAYYGEPGSYTPAVHAATITVRPGQRLTAQHTRFEIGSVPLLALPRFSQRAGPAFLDLSVRAGYRGSLGPYLDLLALAPVAPDLQLGADLGLFGARGVLIGPAARYDAKDGDTSISGKLRSGWIHDFGRRGTDLLGHPVPADREYVEWQHLQTDGDHFTFFGQLKYWSDSEISRDFTPGSFENVQQPDSFLEADYAGRNYFLSAFLRAQPNPWELIQQRLPEIRFDLLPGPLPGGVIQRGSSSFVWLREDPVALGSALTSQRFDAFYALERPWALAPWLTVTPVAGGRVSHYFTALGGRSDYTRVLGEVGADVRARAYATFEVKNSTWQIDGLRHLVEPFLQYRYLPRAERGQPFIPEIDRTVFATRLQPLDLGDIRNLDDLHEINTLRVGIDNHLQTRDGHGGSRDLVSLTLAQDFRFQPAVGESATSALNTDLSLAPAKWLQLDVFQRTTVRDRQNDELNTSLLVTDGEFWSLRAGSQFLRGDIEEYSLATRYRLNERFALSGRWRYDARAHRLNEQTYGLRQNFRNLWALEYQVSFYQGQQREGSFHFRLALEILPF